MRPDLEDIMGFIGQDIELNRILPLIRRVAIIEYNGEDITGSLEVARHYTEFGFDINAVKRIILCGNNTFRISSKEEELKKRFPSATIEKTGNSWKEIDEDGLQMYETLVFHLGFGARINYSDVEQNRGDGIRFREIVTATHHAYCVCVLLRQVQRWYSPASYHVSRMSVGDFTLKETEALPEPTSFCKQKQEYMQMCESTLIPRDVFFQCETEAEHGCEECNQCNAYGKAKRCPIALHKVAGFYRQGMFVPKNEIIAHQWEVMAARQSYLPSQRQVADDFKEGVGCKQSNAEAIKIYTTLADKGDVYSVEQIIKIADENNEIEKIVALPYIAQLAKSGNEEMMIKMSDAFQNGDFGLPIDQKQQERWIRRGAENGNVRFIQAMAEMYEAHCDWPNALKWLKTWNSICPGTVSDRKMDEVEIKMLTNDATPETIAQKGMDYLYGYHWTKRDTNLAYKSLQYASNEGIALATGLLGRMYYYGVKIEKDIKKGIELLSLAAKKGDLLSMDMLFNIHLDEVCIIDGERWPLGIGQAIEDGLDKNDPIAWHMKGLYLFKEYNYDEIDEEVFRCMYKAANMKYPDAQYFLCKMYENGYGTAIDKDMYYHWLKNAADNGYARAEAEYGIHLFCTPGIWNRDEKNRAFSYLESALDKEIDNNQAYWCLAQCYMYGYGTTIDKQKAYPMYIHAAEIGNADAQEKLCEDYFNGNEYLQKDFAESAKWGEEAISKGKRRIRFETAYSLSHIGNHNRAKAIYLELANEGNGAAMNNYACELSDYTEKAEWFQKAVDAGDDYGMWNLGKFYRDGKGVEKDTVKGLQLLNQAAEKGCIGAIKDLAWMYQYGKDVEKDGALAIKWYEKAIDKGDKDSIMDLAKLYMDGIVVDPNMEKAIHYYKMGVETGLTKAMLKLGEIYEKGMGIEKNVTKAIYWYRKAALKNDESAKGNLRRLKVNWIEEDQESEDSYSVQQ